MIPTAMRTARMSGMALCIDVSLLENLATNGRCNLPYASDCGGHLQVWKVGRLGTDYTVRLPAGTHRAAASALSSGRVLKAIAAFGAALRIALMTTSNSARLRAGRRTPAPTTTQS